jgi:radical SAM superfamily enzyme YgiQ (UPF0313 family)
MLVEPLELEVLASLCRPDAEPVVVDLTLERDSFEDFLRRERPDVVALTGYITNVKAMIAACRSAKARDPRTVTIVGGVHCEVCPEHLDDPAVDFRVVRNAVTAFPALLDHVRDKGPVPPGVLRSGERLDPARLPPHDFAWVHPDRRTTARYRDRYFYIFQDKVALLKTAFGCPYRCNFCFCREITSHEYRERALEDVLDELAAIEQREIYIVDDDFLVSEKRVKAFVDGLRRRGIDKHYLVYGRADFIAKHPVSLETFRDAGLSTVIVGFESFLPGELERYGKGGSLETNRAAVDVLNRLGIDCYATLILHPSWGRAEFSATGRALRALGIKNVNLQPLTPLPGTGLASPEEALVIGRDDFARWDLAHVTLRPERMSVSEYYRQIIRLYLVTLYHPRHLLGYLKYPLRMQWRMAAGSRRVHQQYLSKLEEARRLERAGVYARRAPPGEGRP